MTRSMLAVLLVALPTLAGETGLAQASGQAPQDAPARIDVSKLGPQVGERVPDFTLRDQTGQPRSLQSIMGPNGAMLVFNRSAEW